MLGRDGALDEKLAEYAFFPLSQVFNEAQRLSSRCLEVAVQCLQILVGQGWRVKLSPEMGKQLLILMTLLAGGSPAKNQTEPPTDDLKVAAFDCMSALTECMGKLQRGRPIFDEVGARTIVDQSIYVLLEAITDSPSDLVQLAAAHALSSLLEQISNRVVLASLLPRTVSALTKALQPSTQARRTHKVLEAHLELLAKILYAVLNDEVVTNAVAPLASSKKSSETTQEHDADTLPILDKSWLQATSSQVKLALASVMKLRNHGKAEVRQALVRLATMVIEHCSQSLSESVPLLVETLVVLANDSECTTAFSTLKRLATAEPALAESLKSSLHKWMASLPRVMQGSDDRPKERILQQISTTFAVLSEIDESSDVLDQFLATCLVDTVAAAVESVNLRPKQAVMEPPKPSFGLAIVEDANSYASFEAVMLNHGSQKDSMAQLQALITKLGSSQNAHALIKSILDRVTARGTSQLAAIWLALNFLRQPKLDQASVDKFLNFPGDAAPFADSRPYLVSDLYSLTISELVDQPSNVDNTDSDWRVTALALESLVLQADQLGASYRPELIDTLYPVLSLLGASQPDLRTHAMKALTLLGKACDYSSTSDMLIQNADYLINSIALKMNTFDISPQALQVLLMMVRLCGAKLIPYLDDLIGDIFAALDSFHGYPRLVELLFEVLGVVVDEGARQPSLTITNGKEPLEHKKQPYSSSTIGDIITDLQRHKARKRKSEAEDLEPRKSTPHRPWKGTLDGSETLQSSFSDPADEDDALAEGNADEELPLPEKAQPLSKPHTLLLRVAEFSPYHLSSPSPRVRLTVLSLLTRIAAPLSTDENTFLPLVNAIWPALVPRLFANLHADNSDEMEDGVTEPVYTVTAAASTVAALCVGAGDFMAGRIEDIFPSLERMYRQVWDRVAAKWERERGRRRDQRIGRPVRDHAGAGLTGTVDLDLRIVKVNVTSTSIQSPKTSMTRTAYQGTNSSDEQILDALIGLLVAILGYVRITEEMGEVMLDLLAPVMDEPGREAVTDALETWNADAVWLVREQRRVLLEGAAD